MKKLTKIPKLTTSSTLAEALKKEFGEDAHTFTVKRNPRIEKTVNKFVSKIEAAHQNAEHSKLVFKGVQ
jgi:hypothetical protein